MYVCIYIIYTRILIPYYRKLADIVIFLFCAKNEINILKNIS